MAANTRSSGSRLTRPAGASPFSRASDIARAPVRAPLLVRMGGRPHRNRANHFWYDGRIPVPLERTNAAFGTTRWTLLERLCDGTEQQRREAMNEVIVAYWPPVYAAVRRMGRGREEAAEVTQAFFADVMLERAL